MVRCDDGDLGQRTAHNCCVINSDGVAFRSLSSDSDVCHECVGKYSFFLSMKVASYIMHVSELTQ